ncbi:MAG: hypothetical protein M1819_000842 [Sarea resinae]|nr:MAG: hypothetical protein M1819_000842 [Sarea resinae]
MASTAVNRLSRAAQSCSCRITTRQSHHIRPATVATVATAAIAFYRPFSSSISYRDKQGGSAKDNAGASSSNPDLLSMLSPSDRAFYDSLSETDRTEFLTALEQLNAHMTKPSVEASLNSVVAAAAHTVDIENPKPPFMRERINPNSYAAMGEADLDGTGGDDVFEEDDISSLAHAELEQHREIRDYARIAAWEMPLLSKLAKPFTPPSQNQPLRFRYTSYMGESHPAEKKVVLEFCTQDMPDLTEAQRTKLIKLVGVRYNPEKDLVKMSCEMFETQAQNKRYLGDLVDTLLREARDPTDTFADVPFDFRHHPIKAKPKYPAHWRLTPARAAELTEKRALRHLLDTQRVSQGKLIDGHSVITKALSAAQAQQSPIMVEAAGAAGGAGGAAQKGGKKGGRKTAPLRR